MKKRKKVDKKSVKGCLVEYIENCKAYRVYVPNLRDVILNRDVLFKPERISPCTVNVNSFEIYNENGKDECLNDVDETELENSKYENMNEEKIQEPLESPSSVSQKVLRDRSRIKPTEFFGFQISAKITLP